MLLLPGFSWNFKGEADLYRRRPFPRNFLQNEASDYPCYVFQSELSKAFNNQADIKTIVDLLEFEKEIKLVNKNVKNSNFTIEHTESLVTSTKEFMKNILRRISEVYNLNVKPRQNYNLIIKVDG